MISNDLRHFVGASFPTVAHLEAALHFRVRPGTAVSVDEAAAVLYLSPALAQDRLQDLCRAGILAGSTAGGFRWAPRDSVIAALMDDAARAYDKDLRGITSVIHGRSAG